MASWTPTVVSAAAGAERVVLGHRLVDDYLDPERWGDRAVVWG